MGRRRDWLKQFMLQCIVYNDRKDFTHSAQQFYGPSANDACDVYDDGGGGGGCFFCSNVSIKNIDFLPCCSPINNRNRCSTAGIKGSYRESPNRRFLVHSATHFLARCFVWTSPAWSNTLNKISINNYNITTSVVVVVILLLWTSMKL